MNRDFPFESTRRTFLKVSGAALGVGLSRTLGATPPTPEAVSKIVTSQPVEAMPADAVSGRVWYDGQAPVPEEIDCGADPHCALLYRKRPLIDEALVVADDGGLASVFVSVTGGLDKDARWPTPSKPVVLDQKGCRYIPRVIGVRAGQPLEIVNGSKINEAPHGYPKRSPEFSFTLPKRGMKKQVILAEPETFRIECDVHPWELAWCHVMAHPFFVATDPAGRFVLRGLEPGSYELTFWHEHESLQPKTVAVHVQAGQPTRLDDVRFKPSRPRPRRGGQS